VINPFVLTLHESFTGRWICNSQHAWEGTAFREYI